MVVVVCVCVCQFVCLSVCVSQALCVLLFYGWDGAGRAKKNDYNDWILETV